MEFLRRLRIWSGPPLALQIMVLLLSGLVVAQLVTLCLTLLLPPEPQPQYGLDQIARMLSGAASNNGAGRPLQRVVQSGPPDLSGPGWLTSERSRQDLARLLHCDVEDVRLYFFTPLPFAGTAGAPQRNAENQPAPQFERRARAESQDRIAAFQFADYKVAQAAPAGAGGGFPGGGFPGGFPGGGFPGAGVPGGGFPAGNFPRPPIAGMPPGPRPSGPPNIGAPNAPGTQSPPSASTTARPNAGAPSSQAPAELSPGMTPGVRGPGSAGEAIFNGRPRPAVEPMMRVPQIVPPTIIAPYLSVAPAEEPPSPAVPAPGRHHGTPPRIEPEATHAPSPLVMPHAVPSPVQAVAPAPAAKLIARVQPRPQAAAIPLTAPPRGLFGLAPAPFVQGDFVAALQLGTGQWAVVQPTPEPFPNSWQRRVLLWFLFSFALVAPLGWLFARRLVRPIAGFANAAEQLGRDPTALILALEGPAEVGRAAHAFNRMQSRLRSFVDDRTAMVGAISHDLRTPLTRLRFRLEDVPDELRDGMLAEVDEMEQMITSVLSFIRDASEPGSRVMLDLRSIVEDVVEDAVFVGKPVTLGDSERATVEVDPLGMRRLLGNLVENAVKYGDRAQVRLFTDQQDAVAEVSDHGPGLPDEELERVFQPFYRAPAARASSKHGTGLGLAVCRSIARAHGGDVQLRRGERGLVAQVRLPLAYGMTGS